MEWIGTKAKLTDLFRKYRYVLLVLAVGIVLMVLPSGDQKEEPQPPKEAEATLSVEQQLSTILSYIEGAGEVHVMLTTATGEEILYQTNEDYSQSGDTANTRTDTVTVSDAQRSEAGLIRQVNPPVYLGAIVVCKGADSPSVRLAIVEAVSKVTGLGADEISVLKMK